MYTNFLKKCFIAIVLASMSITVSADAPKLVSYQGYLTNNVGQPVSDGPYNLDFRIYDAPTGGTVVWHETHNSVQVTGGRFNVLLGSVKSPSPFLDASAFSDTSRWLGITVGTDPEITERTRLTSAQYAFRVATVDGASGGAISGNINLQVSNATVGNILKGGVPFIHNYGWYNTFIGTNAGNFTTSGDGFNTATGFNALSGNTTGSSNTALGAFSLLLNTDGFNNTACGMSALFANRSGSDNTACGVDALKQNFNGNNNTACGSGSLTANTDGNSNTAIGASAMVQNTVGMYNTASGARALANNTSGSRNTASGFAALNWSDGSDNSAYGYAALQENDDGIGNTAYGTYALRNHAGGDFNTASGDSAMYGNVIGDNNTAAGHCALRANVVGDNNTAIGAFADVSTTLLTNATAIGFNAKVDASNKIRLGNTSVTVIEGQVAYTFSSDKNQKENCKQIDGVEVLRKLREMPLTSWNYIGQNPKQFRHYGPMAQDFYAAFGDDGFGHSGTETTINSGDMAGIMMIAIQALEREREAMVAENQELKARLSSIESDLRKELELLRKQLAGVNPNQ